MADTTVTIPSDQGIESASTAPSQAITLSDQGIPPEALPKPLAPPRVRGPSRLEQLNKLYALPTPLRTFPLPTFVPHNPLSLFHILYIWVSQSIKPTPSHSNPVFQGWLSPDTRSVHVTDARSVRGLWEQGFYGKGTLSRSEPTWLDRENTRLGNKKKNMRLEDVTRARRAQRQATKWERARKEREAIEVTLQEEAEAASQSGAAIEDAISEDSWTEVDSVAMYPIESTVQQDPEPTAPVGPMEILALPNSQTKRDNPPRAKGQCFAKDVDEKSVQRLSTYPVGPLELLALPNCIKSHLQNKSHLPTNLHLPVTPRKSQDSLSDLISKSQPNGHADANIINIAILGPQDNQAKPRAPKTNNSALEVSNITGGSETNDEIMGGSLRSEEKTDTTDTGSTPISGSPITPGIKRQKSVRFSPTVEQNTFMQGEPPSPERALTTAATTSGTTATISETSDTTSEEPPIAKNQEHMQLTLEETFFLSYALGALTVLSPSTNLPIPNTELFHLCRQTSTFPPLLTPALSPDDPFTTNYVVYHHFRSLGWVVRPGIKFSVDFMLYLRGPVFTHAEFCVLVLPSYSDPYWRSTEALAQYAKAKEQRTWAWMSCINRVVTQVKKTLMLTYVDIPAPVSAERERELGIAGVLARYRVREVVLKRWSVNRMRD
ncbi:tRNA-splicing endonuclease subunit [Drepanopeziza brunnea f. sp. 'multigermtubi' MB_m1]|uniref:tRNA-intron lyase n=1 Tax=Marssonina brunnea f. sp. multigermtubi (strain MB_m1) TaxID=1072389 RepID=K1X2P0_MARBU|nr:tRNA-splicing endonuclease subunit [Drepanopeziza brunnea f. sp. 'multigermtubi' MB_m1]EKD19491.1 tRNA-splicing endonuclease subunit [Drepanopeziza brunnea f. sp. 'multigermtubi' MB_m1]